VLDDIRERDRETPVFMITAYGSVEVAVEALKSGANDYFSKPWDNEKLLIEIDRQIARSPPGAREPRTEAGAQAALFVPQHRRQERAHAAVLDLVAQVAPSVQHPDHRRDGTGKELIAKAIHAHSPRAEHMFVAVNSGSVPPDLLESALFGHVKGRLHGRHGQPQGLLRDGRPRHHLLRRDRHAVGRHAGEAAARDPGARVHAGGLERVMRVDVRILAATNADLKKAGGGRQVPRGPVLPAERDQSRSCRRCATARRIFRAGDHFFQIYCRENEKFLDAPAGRCCASSRGHADPDGL
jgi:CheY-like chemotaxis protein